MGRREQQSEHPFLQRNVHWKYASVFYGEEGYNDWKITEKVDKPRNEKLAVEALKLGVLSEIEERTRRIVLEKS